MALGEGGWGKLRRATVQEPALLGSSDVDDRDLRLSTDVGSKRKAVSATSTLPTSGGYAEPPEEQPESPKPHRLSLANRRTLHYNRDRVEEDDSDPDLPQQVIPPMPTLEPPQAVVRSPSAMKALRTELLVLQRELEGTGACRVELMDADLFNWEVELKGPDCSPYQGGIFRFFLHFPVDYPKRMPRIRCATPIFHCNIDACGNVCLGQFNENGLLPASLLPRSNGGNKDQSIDKPRLLVKIISARGLRNADFGGKSDPYCTCKIPGKSWSTFQTAVVDDTLTPVWNEEHIINDYETTDSLEFEVLDDDDEPLTGPDQEEDESLGCGSIDHKAIYPEGFDGEITLQDPQRQSQSQRPTLRVKVTVLEPRTTREHATALDIVEALLSLLALPVLERPLVPANAKLFKEDRQKYDNIAQEWTMQYAL